MIRYRLVRVRDSLTHISQMFRYSTIPAKASTPRNAKRSRRRYFGATRVKHYLTWVSRKGSTILQTLRTAWSAGVLGSTNASQETRRKLDAYTYRACVLVAFQPSCGSLLVADSNGGTPQRFLYVSAQDLEMPQVPPSYPGVLKYEADCEPFGLKVHTEILRELDNNKYRRARNEIVIDPLDTHNDYMRLRIAGLLTLYDRRRFIDLEPWHIAGTTN
jgi:hypothetical protein